MDKIITSQVCELSRLENLFIQLTYANCNLRCKHCYITPHKKLEKSDFISLDLIKNTIYTNATKSVENIYLTGGEPLMHPQFNSILRMCLKRTNTTIITNGININDKKARFFAKVEDEFENSNLYFKIGIEHYDEFKVDDLKGRGTFRKSINAVISLLKYDFSPIILCTNYYNEKEESLIEGFSQILARYNAYLPKQNIKIIPYYDKTNKTDELFEINHNISDIDCRTSRILTSKGVYSCNFLANDYRGRSGPDLNEFSAKTYLEAPCCNLCLKENKKFFTD